jgi:hypothetical protein
MVQNSTIANNISDGIVANAGSQIWLTRSTITGNGEGWTQTAGGTVTTFVDNNIVGNSLGNTEPSSQVPYR